MHRALWKGSLNFGLIAIQVKLYSAVRHKTVNFHQLRAADGCRIGYKKVCATDGAEVAAEDIVKGIEISPDQFLTISAEELASLAQDNNRNIEILNFAPPDQIDPLHLSRSYYLLPDVGSAKTYHLLLAALKRTEKAAIVRFAMRGRENLAVVRPVKQLFCLSTLYFAEEILQPGELEQAVAFTSPPIAERELTMAEQLVQSMSSQFQPQKYTNKYYNLLTNIIERKAAGEKITALPASRPTEKIIDLSAALEASLAAVRPKPEKRERKKAYAR